MKTIKILLITVLFIVPMYLHGATLKFFSWQKHEPGLSDWWAATIADFEKNNGRHVVCDFVCPTKETRNNFKADIVIWMDTIKEGRFEDTNKIFENPKNVDFHITEWNDHNHKDVAQEIIKNV